MRAVKALRCEKASIRLGTALALVLAGFSPALSADYQDGLNAYSEGRFDEAMAQWMDVAGSEASMVNPYVYAETHYAIARLYWEGAGTVRDYYAAREWLEKAAALDHAGAMAKLGFMYTDGLSVPQDFTRAFHWYEESARRGNVDGLYNLGIFYLNGWGTQQDRTLAKQYLAAASAQGDEAAEQALQQLMSEERALAAEAPADDAKPGGDGIPEVENEVANSDAQRPAPIEERSPPAQPVPAVQPDPAVHPENWILQREPSHYTIQAIGLRDRQKLEGLAEAHADLRPFAIYQTQRYSAPIHVLVQGDYPSVEAARAARDRFPRGINSPANVWIRQFDKVQAVIRADRERP